MGNLWNFCQSTWKSQNLDFDGILLNPKYKMYELKIYRGAICHHNEGRCKNWKGIDFSVQNWHEEFDEFWFNHSKISKICTLMGCLWLKCIMFELKKNREVMFDGTEYWYKIWRKSDSFFQKWHEEFGKCSPEHLKVSSFGLWWGPFIESRKCMSLKFTGEVFVMTMKKDTKIEEEFTSQFKTGMRNLTNFDSTTQKSQKFAL